MSAENNLGKKIKELRTNMGYTQERLAELVDIDAKNLSKIENGGHSPSYITLSKLSKVLEFNFCNIDNTQKVEPLSKHKYYQKSLKILNTADSPEELESYYSILKVAQKLIGKSK
ncbi:helix-turn-helix transcriptional regulator [bacterium]|nr:helix-turn-helix transcriptional regulator [bacterium]